jgi:endonuclease/exonuclease/phosphatase family metal-dependent hydrolase
MKLVSLNTWGGKKFDLLAEFIKEQKESTDIFCFQEIFQNDHGIEVLKDGYRANLYKDLEDLLEGFGGYYAPVMKNHDLSGPDISGRVDYDLHFGLAAFIKKDIEVIKVWDEMIHREKFADPGEGLKNQQKNIQLIKFRKDGSEYYLLNFHGIWFPGDKLDTPERIEQSKKVKSLLDKEHGKKILIGDFNLYPETQSIKILEEEMRNLIKEFSVKTTRVQDFKKYGSIQYWADYALISPDINLLDFQVPYREISDHLPLILEFE